MRDDTLGKAEILTPRLRLRRFSMQDMSGFLLFAADADTMLRAGSKPVSTPAEAESELRRAADDPYAFAITLRETGEDYGIEGLETQVLRKISGEWKLQHVHYSK